MQNHSSVELMEEVSSRSSTASSSLCRDKPAFKKRRSKFQFFNLPEDIQCTILSELPLKEVARTSILSSKWRSVGTIHPKLRFDGTTMCSSRSICGSKQYTEEFIQNVNAVLKEHNGIFVEDFEIKFEFSSELVIHLDNWVRFVAASHTKNLAFDLVPDNYPGRDDRYLLPTELLGSESAFRLQHIQFGFVSIKLPSQFSGFPNLRKLDLNLVHVTAKDLQDMLSNCGSNLEWLSMVRCHLYDELKLASPLSNLLYLSVIHCCITEIEFHAMRLKTFVYKGEIVPISLNESLELENAEFFFFIDFTLEHALTTLPKTFPSVKKLNVRAWISLKTPWLLQNFCKFSFLKCLQLTLTTPTSDEDNILSLASYLLAAPSVEKLEINFAVLGIPLSENQPIRSLPRKSHSCLKDVLITGFTAVKSQVELLVYIVDNAPALEILSIDVVQRIIKDTRGFYTKKGVSKDEIYGVAASYLEGKISKNVKFDFL